MSHAYSLFPLRDIYTLHKKPQTKRRFANQWRNQNGGNYQICECGGKKRGKTGGQIASTGDLHQYAYEFGKIARSKNQITIHKARAAKKYQGNIEGNVMRLQSEVRENL
jgi:hypothetical protein